MKGILITLTLPSPSRERGRGIEAERSQWLRMATTAVAANSKVEIPANVRDFISDRAMLSSVARRLRTVYFCCEDTFKIIEYL